jgi:hypothetical protein
MWFTAEIRVDSVFTIKVDVEAEDHYKARDKAVLMVADGFFGTPKLEVLNVKELIPVPARCA